MAASAPQTEMTGVVFSRSPSDASLFNRISSPLCNSFSLPGKSRSFYLMWCFYVQFPSPTPIIGRYATVAGNKAADGQQRQQSKLGETFKRSHLLSSDKCLTAMLRRGRICCSCTFRQLWKKNTAYEGKELLIESGTGDNWCRGCPHRDGSVAQSVIGERTKGCRPALVSHPCLVNLRGSGS